MTKGFKIVIPARFASSRLPGKPLLEIAGKPMIAHVCQRALQSKAEEVIVATDDDRIFQVVEKLGIKVLMTASHHQSGTERIAEVAKILAWPEDIIVVNLQGDEPLIPPHYINQLAECLALQNQAGIATLAAKITDINELFNANAVKVVMDKFGNAVYFSRAAIPWDRANFAQQPATLSNDIDFYRHIGIYAYTVNFLQSYCSWSASPLESIEALEQLRMLWHGEKIRVVTVASVPEAGVDTEADLQRVARRLAQSS